MNARQLVLAGVAAIAPLAAHAFEPPLRVCADPNDLPFSNAAGEGFENKIAQLIADDLHRPLEYVWRAQRRGFLREGLNAGLCDLVTAVPSGLDMIRETTPYYRSTYVFVSRAGDPAASSFDDPSLRVRKVGVQLIGDQGMNTPPAHALAQRGVIDNVRGFPVYGDYRKESPAADIVRAVADREIDVAAVWGPVGDISPSGSRRLSSSRRLPLRERPAFRWCSTLRWACESGTTNWRGRSRLRSTISSPGSIELFGNTGCRSSRPKARNRRRPRASLSLAKNI